MGARNRDFNKMENRVGGRNFHPIPVCSPYGLDSRTYMPTTSKIMIRLKMKILYFISSIITKVFADNPLYSQLPRDEYFKMILFYEHDMESNLIN